MEYLNSRQSQNRRILPVIRTLGDQAIVVSFSAHLSIEANASAIIFSKTFDALSIFGVDEVVPSLVSVLVRFNPTHISLGHLLAEIRMSLSTLDHSQVTNPKYYKLDANFGGENGPDLKECALALEMSPAQFIQNHNSKPLTVLSVGFAPGFLYCGLHDAKFALPRRTNVRAKVPAGSILFAAGQTAIAATDIPTGWSVIGRTTFRNFQPNNEPPVLIVAGDAVEFFESDS